MSLLIKEYTTTYSIDEIKPQSRWGSLWIQLLICKKCKGHRNMLNCPMKEKFSKCGKLHRSKSLSSSTEIVRKSLKRYQVKKGGRRGQDSHLDDKTREKPQGGDSYEKKGRAHGGVSRMTNKVRFLDLIVMTRMLIS